MSWSISKFLFICSQMYTAHTHTHANITYLRCMECAAAAAACLSVKRPNKPPPFGSPSQRYIINICSTHTLALTFSIGGVYKETNFLSVHVLLLLLLFISLRTHPHTRCMRSIPPLCVGFSFFHFIFHMCVCAFAGRVECADKEERKKVNLRRESTRAQRHRREFVGMCTYVLHIEEVCGVCMGVRVCGVRVSDEK